MHTEMIGSFSEMMFFLFPGFYSRLASTLLQLAAQAEAEKRNIGTVDSLHREVDHVKNVIEEKESIHREFNK